MSSEESAGTRVVDRRLVEPFIASLKRCLAVPGFMDGFYQRFVTSSDEVRQKFRNTDLTRQARMLSDSLYALAVAVQGQRGSPAWGDMPRLAARHSRQDLDIPAHLYDHWLACLVETARSNDPEFTPEIEAAWRATLGVGIAYMKERY
jgi:hemoglobin-like flavoprotein